MKSSLVKFVFASIIVGLSSSASAQKAGDFIAGVGGALIVPNASVGSLNSTSTSNPYGVATANYFNNALNGANATIGSTSTIVFSGLYMWTDNIATELSIGLPPTMTVDLYLPNGSDPKAHNGAATAKALTPSLVAKYLFNSPGNTWRPYLGLGFTYASFRDVTANTSDATVNALAGNSASLSSSFAPVFNVGTIYNIDDKWSINASISYIPLKTDATFSGPGAAALGSQPVNTTGTLTINPLDYVVRLGYKF
jgi:outer membrane protein